MLDAHSLYLETLAELGLVGLALLVLALAPPLVAGFRGVEAAATGGYVAFLIHAGLDWDWELPAVTDRRPCLRRRVARARTRKLRRALASTCLTR